MTGIVSLSFDNLGEAAEIELGAVAPDAPGIGSHPTVTVALPRILDQLEKSGVPATFFVEGINAELYPEALREIASRGHEVGFHAWRHEEWAKLSADAQAANLKRGLAALAGLGIEVTGMRPPGGGLGPGSTSVLREAGLRYSSPEGSEVRVENGVAVLPFAWRHVDAACVLPLMGSAREQMTGSTDPVEPDAFALHLERELMTIAEEGGFLTIILHPFMLEWLDEERLARMLDRIAAGHRRGEFQALPMEKVAALELGEATRA